jgi:transcriptional regulator with XRE-family HTH domain
MSKSHSQPKSDLSITADEAARIGGRIRKLRGTASQREFATRLGISREQLSRIESGAQVPGTETLRRLAQATRVPLDFVLLGGAPAAPRPSATEAGGAWETALEPLLGGTTIRVPRPSVASARKADRAWRELPEERREEVREFVRRIAVVAVAIEALLPAKAAKAVTDELATELSTVVVDRILAARSRRPVS